ncbi:hypothetical protein JDV02_005170 [Purpureocillium takamizusanense]|uniref:Uncharacterized protein n=1 Tax=Purpureocillium takamizusanense TaxID=2060973 RepID=A0A9Q8QGR1_9HYPO|nr:uncharacterized protein JDV02_005170 [Purpureocillium takamizusanense]UNI18942.1 hypothetical protein JDV02_005170 [Purpureocillium takamizusanense]
MSLSACAAAPKPSASSAHSAPRPPERPHPREPGPSRPSPSRQIAFFSPPKSSLPPIASHVFARPVASPTQLPAASFLFCICICIPLIIFFLTLSPAYPTQSASPAVAEVVILSSRANVALHPFTPATLEQSPRFDLERCERPSAPVTL